MCRNYYCALLKDGLWGAPASWSHELLTYECPPKYCKCEGSLDDPNLNEGCQLLYDDDNGICNDLREGNAELTCLDIICYVPSLHISVLSVIALYNWFMEERPCPCSME